MPSASHSKSTSSHKKRNAQLDVTPYLTHITTHHGQLTLIPPDNAGRVRKAKSAKAHVKPKAEATPSQRPGDSRTVFQVAAGRASRTSVQSRADRPPAPPDRSPLRSADSLEDMDIPDVPPPSFQEAISSPPSTRTLSQDTVTPGTYYAFNGSRFDLASVSPTSRASSRSPTMRTISPLSQSPLSSPTSTEPSHASHEDEDSDPDLEIVNLRASQSLWEEDRNLGMEIGERVERELARQQATDHLTKAPSISGRSQRSHVPSSPASSRAASPTSHHDSLPTHSLSHSLSQTSISHSSKGRQGHPFLVPSFLRSKAHLASDTSTISSRSRSPSLRSPSLFNLLIPDRSAHAAPELPTPSQYPTTPSTTPYPPTPSSPTASSPASPGKAESFIARKLTKGKQKQRTPSDESFDSWELVEESPVTPIDIDAEMPPYQLPMAAASSVSVAKSTYAKEKGSLKGDKRGHGGPVRSGTSSSAPATPSTPSRGRRSPAPPMPIRSTPSTNTLSTRTASTRTLTSPSVVSLAPSMRTATAPSPSSPASRAATVPQPPKAKPPKPPVPPRRSAKLSGKPSNLSISVPQHERGRASQPTAPAAVTLPEARISMSIPPPKYSSWAEPASAPATPELDEENDDEPDSPAASSVAESPSSTPMPTFAFGGPAGSAMDEKRGYFDVVPASRTATLRAPQAPAVAHIPVPGPSVASRIPMYHSAPVNQDPFVDFPIQAWPGQVQNMSAVPSPPAMATPIPMPPTSFPTMPPLPLPVTSFGPRAIPSATAIAPSRSMYNLASDGAIPPSPTGTIGRRHYPGRPLPAPPPVSAPSSPPSTQAQMQTQLHAHLHAPLPVTASAFPSALSAHNDGWAGASTCPPIPYSARYAHVERPVPTMPTAHAHTQVNSQPVVRDTALRSLDGHAYTDFDMLIARLDRGARDGTNYEALTLVSDILGPATPPPAPPSPSPPRTPPPPAPATAPPPGQMRERVLAMHSSPPASPVSASSRRSTRDTSPLVGRVEMERRRVTRDGRVKLKLSLLGVVVDRCGICLSQFRDGEQAGLGPVCRHAFHEHCLAPWLSTNRTCPLCRAPLGSKR